MSGLKNKLLSVFMSLTFCVISVFCPFVSVQAIDPITAAIIGFVVEEAVDYLIQYAYENRFKTFEQCAYVVSFWSSVVSSESLTKSQFEELVLYYYSGYLSDIENNPNFINYFGKTKNLRDLMNVLSFADTLICADSAPLHIGVGLNLNIVAIFGPTNEEKLVPKKENIKVITNKEIDCRPCLWHKRKINCNQSHCLNINVSDVLNAI